jgi:hypothetical protein
MRAGEGVFFAMTYLTSSRLPAYASYASYFLGCRVLLFVDLRAVSVFLSKLKLIV